MNKLHLVSSRFAEDATTEQELDGLAMRIGTWLVVLLCLLFFGGLSSPAIGEELPRERYQELLSAYRSGDHESVTEVIRQFSPSEVIERNRELSLLLDVTRPDEARTFRAAIVLMGDMAAIASTSDEIDAYLDEVVRLATELDRLYRVHSLDNPALADKLARGEGLELQKNLHLAAAMRLLNGRRVTDALVALAPAGTRFREDGEVQFALGTLYELSGWLNASERHLRLARDAYWSVLSAEPNARTRLRLARVLSLLGDDEGSLSQLERGLAGELRDSDRIIGLLTLGDVRRRRGEPSDAIEVYEEARALDPACQAAQVSLAYTFQQLGRLEQARWVLHQNQLQSLGARRDCFQLYLMSDAPTTVTKWRELRRSVR